MKLDDFLRAYFFKASALIFDPFECSRQRRNEGEEHRSGIKREGRKERKGEEKEGGFVGREFEVAGFGEVGAIGEQ